MKPSKLADVGQIFRSSGISMKIRMKAQTLQFCQSMYCKKGAGGSQAYHAEENHPVEVEDVCYAECEAQDYAEHATPGREGLANP